MYKRKTNLALLIVGLVIPILAVGCAGEPTEEIKAADAAS